MLFVLVAAAIGVLFLAHTAPFPFLLDRIAPGRSLWRVPDAGGTPTIYLTFDDGPNPAATPQLLDVLASEGAVATFFLIDRHVTPDTAPIVRRIFEEGHAVGLHSHTRGHMMMSPGKLADTLVAAADRIEALAGERPCRVYRPHAGWRSSNMYRGLARINHALVGWGWTLWDWNWFRAPAPEALAARLTRRVTSGDIVVMHDGHHENPRADRLHTVEAIEKLVPALRAKGFSFGTIC